MTSHPDLTQGARLSRIFVFGSREGGPGNEATVVRCPGGLPDPAVMRQVAQARATPVSAFIGGTAEPFDVRFFTPSSELSFCGHGSLAAGSVLAREMGAQQVRLRAGQTEATVHCDTPGMATFAMKGPAEVLTDFDRRPVLDALGLSEEGLDPHSPFVIASVGSPKWLVPVRDPERLRALKPRFAELADWSTRRGVNGAYVYTCHGLPPGVHVQARAFNPKSGAAEDAATGVAVAALAWVLRDVWKNSPWFVVEQGLELRDLNRLRARISDDLQIHVGGEVRFAEL
jgi:trans-2,3-dihydro-3-hydroxyanthranilate isomerase